MTTVKQFLKISLIVTAFPIFAHAKIKSFENCTYQDRHQKTEVTPARKCVQVSENTYLVSLCDGHECLADNNVKEAPHACSGKRPAPGMETVFHQLSSLYWDEKSQCARSDSIGINEGFVDGLSRRANELKKLNVNGKLVLVFPAAGSKERHEAIDVFRSLAQLDAKAKQNSCYHQLKNELGDISKTGFDFFWPGYSSEQGAEQLFDLKAMKWVRFSDAYPRCE